MSRPLAVQLSATPPANASLLGGVTGTLTGTIGGVVGTTTNLVGGLIGVVTAGWDDGATTPPVTLSQVASAIGADDMWGRGYTGQGVGVAVIDSGVAPVQGLTTPGKIVNGPDLSFESQVNGELHLDTYGHDTHITGIIAGDDGSANSWQGVAPNAHLMPIKSTTHDGATVVSQVVAAIN